MFAIVLYFFLYFVGNFFYAPYAGVIGSFVILSAFSFPSTPPRTKLEMEAEMSTFGDDRSGRTSGTMVFEEPQFQGLIQNSRFFI
jgi:hypothetical protein